MRSLFGLLRPHLQYAFGLLLELSKRDAVPANPDFWLNRIPTAAFLVLPDGKVAHFNSQAEQFLRTSKLLYTDRAVRLAARTQKLQNQVQSALTKASATSVPVGPVPLNPTGNGGPFFFVMPVRHKDHMLPGFAPFLSPSIPLLVTLFDPADVPRPSEKILSAAFGLTERECLVIQQLILGASLKEAADTLQISYNTARNHLASATSKTGAHSQADIVRRGTQILAKLGCGPN